MIMPSETDVAPKAISGQTGLGLEISGRGYALGSFGANYISIIETQDWKKAQLADTGLK